MHLNLIPCQRKLRSLEMIEAAASTFSIRRSRNRSLESRIHMTMRTNITMVPGIALLMGLTGSVATSPDETTPILHEDFAVEQPVEKDGVIQARHSWWNEGGERVWIEDGRLHVKADPEDANDPDEVATVWCTTPFSGNVRIEMDAHVVSSSIGANNINVFFLYSDPMGKPLFDSRESRADGAYRHYHQLNGYIVTFLRDRQEESGLTPEGHPHARIRLRRCPDFQLVNATYDEMGVKHGITYRLAIERKNGTITFEVDGKQFLEWTDPDPLQEGLLGLRTFRTYLWWDNIRVVQLDD